MENWLPWHGQMISPPCTWVTRQPWWVQIAVNALKSPLVGWVTTTCWAVRIFPPPTGTSDVVIVPPPPPEPWLAPPDSPPDSPPDEPPLVSLPPPQAASKGRATPPTAAPRSIVLRSSGVLGVLSGSVMALPVVS